MLEITVALREAEGLRAVQCLKRWIRQFMVQVTVEFRYKRPPTYLPAASRSAILTYSVRDFMQWRT